MNVMFLGDSLTAEWDPTIWKTRLEPLGAVNLGVSGAGTAQLLWRIERGYLDKYAPKLIVLMIGINNVWPGYSAADTARGIESIVAAIRLKWPDVKVLLLGVLPIFDKADNVRGWIKTVNARIAKLAGVHFLDIGDKFTESDGALRDGFYSVDGVHLQPPAYKLLADTIEPLIKEMSK
ncbi:MAG: GDSL family lipase [Verrucomicrobia bacterium]|nr:GDSL family lipase [Verrucomicrobiota bacterium]